MLCENCRKKEASVHLTEIHNGVQTERHLCGECAVKLEVPGYQEVMNDEVPFVQLLTGLLAAGGMAAVRQETPLHHISCPGCGMKFDEFTRVGKFGCAECYDVFGPLIDDNMKCIHGDNVHNGKKYKTEAAKDNEGEASSDSEANVKKQHLEELQLRLKEAVEIENFEEAARFRDEIRALKGGLNPDA